jgi:D-3-phosphoglycerate dehydrogenase
VNVSQPRFVNESALLDALEAGTIAGAALDVLENEPRVNPRFLACGNVLLSPHAAWKTEEVLRNRAYWVVRNIEDHFARR